jgi:uroporphyrin-III C-methyltransferase
MTLRGWQALLHADVVVHDRLGCEEILQCLPPIIRRVDVGKQPGERRISQELIQETLLREAQAGNAVVRLKGGDPFVFGRGGEEAIYLQERGVPVLLVSGVSSAVSGPAAGGIPVTHRAVARSFAVYTGRDEAGLPASDRPDTRIYLMGVSAAPQLVNQLRAEGVPESTPIGIVSWATTYRQRVLRSTLGALLADLHSAAIEPPTVIIVGEVGALPIHPASYTRTILLTALDFPRRLLSDFPAARLVRRPLLGTLPLEEPPTTALAEAANLDWILFHGQQGVRAVLDAWRKGGLDLRRVRARLATLGASAAEELAATGIFADLRLDSSQLAGAFPPGSCVALPIAFGQQLHAAEALRAQQIDVREIPFCRTIELTPPPIDWTSIDSVWIPSSALLERLLSACPEAPLDRLEALVPGAKLAQRCLEAGFRSAR